MAKLAVAVEQALQRRALNGTPGDLTTRVLARDEGWYVEDVVCSSGPSDRPFEERHGHVTLALIGAGSFQYRSSAGRELMTPGSILLGNVGQCFECGHEHAAGDRCLAFHYTPEYFERLAADAGARGSDRRFRRARLPPVRALSPLVARGCAGLAGSVDVPWEELSIQLAARAVQLAGGLAPDGRNDPPGALARVTRTVRAIERRADDALTLGHLAREAGLSPYHFLRTFQRLTGVTPHQYVLRARLREAAMHLAGDAARVLDIALACGFGDLSNFNRAFRAEFGVSPREYRRCAAEGARMQGCKEARRQAVGGSFLGSLNP